jgi:catalase
MHIQVMTFAEAEKFKWNPFDLTKVNQNFTLCEVCSQESDFEIMNHLQIKMKDIAMKNDIKST